MQTQFIQLLLNAYEAALTGEMPGLGQGQQQTGGLTASSSMQPGSTSNAMSSLQWLSMYLPQPSAPPTTYTSLANGSGGILGLPLQTGTSVSNQVNSLINQASAKYGVPAELIHSVIQQESGFNTNAVSQAGAVGLMQLMPATWKSYQVTNPYDPAQNIDAGTHYLSDLIHRFNGNTNLALAAYNAGPAAVTHYGGIPPYPETQLYVSQILNRINV